MLPLLAIGGIAIVLLALTAGRSKPPGPRYEGGPLVSRGSSKTLFVSTIQNDRFIDPPQKLYADAQKKAGFPIPWRAFLLATMAASEYGSSSKYPNILKAGVMHAALNFEKKFRLKTGAKTTLDKMLLGTDGKLGGQRGRYASTNNPPTLNELQVALDVLSGKIPDPTGGAIQFDDPNTQRYLNKQRPKTPQDKGGFDTPEVIAMQRMAAGRRATYIPGVNPQEARFWA